MLALSRRNFERRFKKATSNTVVEYMQKKIKSAEDINKIYKDTKELFKGSTSFQDGFVRVPKIIE